MLEQFFQDKIDLLNQAFYHFSCCKQIVLSKKIVWIVFETQISGTNSGSLYLTCNILIFTKTWNTHLYTCLLLHIKICSSIFFPFGDVVVRRFHIHMYKPISKKHFLRLGRFQSMYIRWKLFIRIFDRIQCSHYLR